VYNGMRRATLLIASVLLAVPAFAHAKAGVEFEQYPETTKVGKSINFTVMAFRDPPPSGGSGHPVVGAHPLVTFRSRSGSVIRVRAGATDLNGLGYGKVAFPDKGPWSTEMKIRGVHIGSERSQPISVGVGLTQTIPPARRTVPAASDRSVQDPQRDDGFPWVWVLSGASILSALLVAGMRRRGHWGTA
jgi:hypothetical protein